MERSSSITGKMNEKPWSILHGSERTIRQNKKNTKDRCHGWFKRIRRINKKQGRFEMSKKGNRYCDYWRCD